MVCTCCGSVLEEMRKESEEVEVKIMVVVVVGDADGSGGSVKRVESDSKAVE